MRTLSILALCLTAAACGDDTTAKPGTPMGQGGSAPMPEASVDAAPSVDATDASTNVPETNQPSTGDATLEASTIDAVVTSDATVGPAMDARADTMIGLVADATPGADASDADTTVATGPFSILAIAELGGIHGPFVDAAKVWLAKLATERNLTIKYVENTATINDTELAKYALVLQLNYPPWMWTNTAEAAFEKYMTEGRGGWIGLHHASLYGPSVTPSSETPWAFMYNFLGKINFKDYIATFAEGTVHVEVPTHPLFKGVPSTFQVLKDEWYTWDKNPRPNVHVLANVDENSYKPPSNIKMGDHPVIWSNEAFKGRNAYMLIGHDRTLFENEAYMTLLRNAIFWAAGTGK